MSHQGFSNTGARYRNQCAACTERNAEQANAEFFDNGQGFVSGGRAAALLRSSPAPLLDIEEMQVKYRLQTGMFRRKDTVQYEEITTIGRGWCIGRFDWTFETGWRHEQTETTKFLTVLVDSGIPAHETSSGLVRVEYVAGTTARLVTGYTSLRSKWGDIVTAIRAAARSNEVYR